MGLIDQIKSGSILTRGTVTLSNTPEVSGSTTDFGSTYILLGMSADNPCRVRLYSDSASVGYDFPRPSSSFDYSASVGLNLDVGLTPGTQSLVFDPPVIGTTYLFGKTWYNIDSAVTPTNVSVTYYPIEFNTGSRKAFIFGPTTLAGNTSQLGNKTNIPKSFLIQNAYSDFTNLRLRLYSKPIETITATEISRSFITGSADGAYLICDMLFDSASYAYIVSPLIQAYNLENYLNGNNLVGYILENLSPSTQTNASALIYVYPIED